MISRGNKSIVTACALNSVPWCLCERFPFWLPVSRDSSERIPSLRDSQTMRSEITGIGIPGCKLSSRPRLKPAEAWRRTNDCKTGVLHGARVLLILGAVDRGAVDRGAVDRGAE